MGLVTDTRLVNTLLGLIHGQVGAIQIPGPGACHDHRLLCAPANMVGDWPESNIEYKPRRLHRACFRWLAHVANVIVGRVGGYDQLRTKSVGETAAGNTAGNSHIPCHCLTHSLSCVT